MIRNRKTPLLFVVALIIVALGLVGCAPSQQAATPTTAAPTDAPTAVEATVTAEEVEATEAVAEVTCTLLNLNELSEDDLLSTIPDFSNRMVREFFEYRPYVSIQQFRREIGKYVDEAQVAIYEQYVYVPVDPNESDADTLMQIPGVDEADADALIAGRPYVSNNAFLAALADLVNAQELAQAACYLVEA